MYTYAMQMQYLQNKTSVNACLSTFTLRPRKRVALQEGTESAKGMGEDGGAPEERWRSVYGNEKIQTQFLVFFQNHINYLPPSYLREVAQNPAGTSSKPPGADEEHEKVLKPTSEWF